VDIHAQQLMSQPENGGHDEIDFEFLGDKAGRPVTLQTNLIIDGQSCSLQGAAAAPVVRPRRRLPRLQDPLERLPARVNLFTPRSSWSNFQVSFSRNNQ